MFCGNCGSNAPDGANVCPNCGSPLATQAQQYQQPQQPQQDFNQYQYQQYQQPASTVNDGKSLTFGILSICLCWLPALGIIFGIIARKNAKAYLAENGFSSGKNKTGSILGMFGLIFGIICSIYWLIYIFIIIAATS